MDQSPGFRDTVLALVQDQQFLAELQVGWHKFTDATPPIPGSTEVGNALLMELRAFPLAIEVAQITEKAARESKGWLSKWLGRASTATGSVKDPVKNLSPYAKSAITLFKELIDLFKGKD